MQISDYYLPLLFLRYVPGIGTVKQNRIYLPLIKAGADISELSEMILQKEKRLTAKDVERSIRNASEAYEKVIADPNITVQTALDAEYPQKLRDLGNDKPVILYVMGDPNSLKLPGIGVIGTRNPQEEYAAAERKYVSNLVQENGRKIAIVSGLAEGCDAVAHRTTLDNNGSTIAVLPCGFEYIYPQEHNALAEEIARSSGCLISEYEPWQHASAKLNYMFINRDRLIAALSDRLVVTETGPAGGTMITANVAYRLRRPISCLRVPGKTPPEGNSFLVNKRGASWEDIGKSTAASQN